MIKRRGFLKYSSALALGSLLLNRLPAQSDFFSDSKPGSIGVQLFSVPRMLEKDFAGTMKMLAQIGYKEISEPTILKLRYLHWIDQSVIRVAQLAVQASCVA